jgi:hypothetical protein
MVRKQISVNEYFSRPSNQISEVGRRLEYYKRLRDQLDAVKTKQAQVMFRRNLMQTQNRMNYTNELDRIRGELSKTMLNGVTAERLHRRANELDKLFKKNI